MSLGIRVGDADGARVPADILGHNIEACLTTIDGLLADRLRNPKLLGPPDRMTGLPREWQGASCGRGQYELTPNGGLGGSEALLIRIHGDAGAPHFHQNRISVREGETLELEIWARAWHEPVTLDVSLLPLPKPLEPYATGAIEVVSSYFRRYRVTFEVPRDDNSARLSVSVRGTGELWIDQLHLRPAGEYLSRPLIREIRGMRIPTLRFPGGIVTNCYQWRNGTGPTHLRPVGLDAAFHQPWMVNYDFGLDEYLDLCIEERNHPAITLNLGTGTAEDASELAAYCADRFDRTGMRPEIYWHVGNHPYHYTTTRMTAAMYAEVLETFVPKLRAAYPEGRIVAVMSRADLVPDGPHSEWREAVIDRADRLVDIVEVQSYGGGAATPDPPGSYQGGDEPGGLLERIEGSLESLRNDLAEFCSDLERRGVNLQVGIAEWNWWAQASHWDGIDFEEPPTLAHVLFLSGMIHVFARFAPRFAAAHFYNLVNCMGILNRRGAEVEVTGSVELFNLYRPALPGTIKAIDAPEPRPEGIDLLALSNDSRWLFLANRTLEPRELELENGEPRELVSLSGGTITDEAGRRTFAPAGRRVVLPPLSVTRVRYD